MSVSCQVCNTVRVEALEVQGNVGKFRCEKRHTFYLAVPAKKKE